MAEPRYSNTSHQAPLSTASSAQLPTAAFISNLDVLEEPQKLETHVDSMAQGVVAKMLGPAGV